MLWMLVERGCFSEGWKSELRGKIDAAARKATTRRLALRFNQNRGEWRNRVGALSGRDDAQVSEFGE